MSNEKLNKAKKIKNDEFYTLYEDVERIFKNFEPLLKHYEFDRIELPFDTSESNFTKYCKDNNLNYHNTHADYINHNYSKNGVVISNPPFSKLREIVEFYIKNNINFILIIPLGAVAYKKFIEYYNENKLNYYYLPINNFITPNNEIKNVRCYVMSNIDSLGYLINERYWVPNFLKPPLVDENNVMIRSGFIPTNDWDKYYLTISYLFTNYIYCRVQVMKKYKVVIVNHLHKPNSKQDYFERIKLMPRENEEK